MHEVGAGGVKNYRLVDISKSWDVMHSMVTKVVNSGLHVSKLLRVILKVLRTGKKFVVYTYSDTQ